MRSGARWNSVEWWGTRPISRRFPSQGGGGLSRAGNRPAPGHEWCALIFDRTTIDPPIGSPRLARQIPRCRKRKSQRARPQGRVRVRVCCLALGTADITRCTRRNCYGGSCSKTCARESWPRSLFFLFFLFSSARLISYCRIIVIAWVFFFFFFLCRVF